MLRKDIEVPKLAFKMMVNNIEIKLPIFVNENISQSSGWSKSFCKHFRQNAMLAENFYNFSVLCRFFESFSGDDHLPDLEHNFKGKLQVPFKRAAQNDIVLQLLPCIPAYAFKSCYICSQVVKLLVDFFFHVNPLAAILAMPNSACFLS